MSSFFLIVLLFIDDVLYHKKNLNMELFMVPILADYSASISELKKNPSSLISSADDSAVAVLNHNKPTAYLVPAKTYEKMMELLEDIDLKALVEERESQLSDAVEVSLDEL